MSAHTLRGSQVVCMLLKLGEDQVILFKQRAHTLNTRYEIFFALMHSFFFIRNLALEMSTQFLTVLTRI